MGVALHGISPVTGLPRYVIRIRANGSEYHYFRHREVRERLPHPADRKFAATYAAILVEHGLAEQSTRPARPLRSIKGREVYFIEDPAAALIKIGVARWPKDRLQTLQIGTASPLRLLASMPGEEPLERELHQRFASIRVRGEWFRATPELYEAVAEAAA